MSLYSKYLKEREDADIVETSWGFASYKCTGIECYIQNIYVDPEFRKAGMASQLADQITTAAKERGCKYLVGTVATKANGATDSLKVLLAYGFSLVGSDSQLIYFKKDI